MPRPFPVSSAARRLPAALAFLACAAGCTVVYHRNDDPSELPEARVRPGISVLLRDSIGVISGKRIAILTNQSGVDEKGTSDVDLLRTDKRATGAHVQLVEVFSPEHGFRGTEDHPGIPSTVDQKTGLPIISLYGAQGTSGPPDSAVQKVDMILIDLQDVGSRTWTYQGAMVYTMRAAAAAKKPVVVLDRPNPISGSIVEGPVLDSALASEKIAWALYPIPIRHGMTMGELARFYNDVFHIGATLHVIPARGWTREIWFDRTGLPFVTPSPSLRSLESEMLYTALVPFEASNVSVGRGTREAFQRVGAPWLNADSVIKVLKQRPVRGVRFDREDFTPQNPGDEKYGGQTIPGIRITVTDRSALQTARLCAALLSAIHRVHPTQLTLQQPRFDRLWGSPAVREAILAGQDPDAVIDSTYGPAYAFRQRVRPYLMY
jgi:uncharacterized protein YbbC (DUF1343 family)